MARTVRGVAEAPDRATSLNLDAVGVAIGDIPEVYWTEGRLLSVTFTASKLDQTIAHGLGGKHKFISQMMIRASAPISIYETNPNSKLVDTHVRVVASGACTTALWVWR